jgi:hypothetical protein
VEVILWMSATNSAQYTTAVTGKTRKVGASRCIFPSMKAVGGFGRLEQNPKIDKQEDIDKLILMPKNGTNNLDGRCREIRKVFHRDKRVRG